MMFKFYSFCPTYILSNSTQLSLYGAPFSCAGAELVQANELLQMQIASSRLEHAVCCTAGADFIRCTTFPSYIDTNIDTRISCKMIMQCFVLWEHAVKFIRLFDEK
jgi:hypothetical protein